MIFISFICHKKSSKRWIQRGQNIPNALLKILPRRELPSEAGWSSAISEPGFEFRITKTFLPWDLTLFKSKTFTDSNRFENPKFTFPPFNPERCDGNVPAEAIFNHDLHYNKSYTDQNPTPPKYISSRQENSRNSSN